MSRSGQHGITTSLRELPYRLWPSMDAADHPVNVLVSGQARTDRHRAAIRIPAVAVRDQPIFSQLPRDICRSSPDTMSTGDAARGCMTRHPAYC
jgi:hypothetical protein